VPQGYSTHASEMNTLIRQAADHCRESRKLW